MRTNSRRRRRRVASPGERAPAVVWVHGGPEAQFTPYFNAVIQYLVGHGYIVAAPSLTAREASRRLGVAYDDKRDQLRWAADLFDAVEYGYRYLAEVQFRFNRRYDMRAMLGSLLRALVVTPKLPERGIRVAEVHR